MFHKAVLLNGQYISNFNSFSYTDVAVALNKKGLVS